MLVCADRLHEFQHRCISGAFADDLDPRREFAHRIAQALVLDIQQLLFERIHDDMIEIVGVDGLGDVIVCAFLQRAHRGLDRRECRHDDDDDLPVHLLDPVQEFHAVHPGHADVHEHQVPVFRLKRLERGGAVGRSAHPEAILPEPFCEGLPDDQFIINDEYAQITFLHEKFLIRQRRDQILTVDGLTPRAEAR